MKFELNENDLASTVMELRSGLGGLTFSENFKSFKWVGTIGANTETIIPNKLRDRIPTGFIVTMISGSSQLVKGAAEWTTGFLSLKNLDAVNALTATVYFIDDGRA